MTATTRNIFLPIFVICIIIFCIGIICWRSIFRNRRPIYPYNNPQLAFVTQTYHQQRPYQTAWPSLPVEQPPPPYYTVANIAMIPPSVSNIKQ